MPTAPAEIERLLVRQILRGEVAPGDRLPGVRALATAHGVSPATIQRAVDRLKARRLVTARQGSGLTVQDPWEVGDVSLLPDWLDALRDRPDEAAALLAEFLELRRSIAARLLVTHREAVLASVPDLLGLAAAVAGEGDRAAIQRADLAFARALLRGTGNRAAVALLNTLERVLDAMPALSAAMYASPDDNVAAMTAVLLALGQGGSADRVERLMAEVDARTVRRFAAGLAAG